MKDFNFNSKYFISNSIRIHYIDEGSESNPIILLLHGVPSWSYIYRNIIPICINNGFRVIAPDLPGFGLSDKPQNKEFYTLQNIVNHLNEFLKIFGDSKITFFGQDWGSIIGMCLLAISPEKFQGAILSNGLLPDETLKLPRLLKIWKLATKVSPILPIGRIINYGSLSTLTKEEMKGYNYPFTSNKSKIAVRQYPRLIYSNFKQHPEKEYLVYIWDKLKTTNIPVLTAFSNSDPITSGSDKVIQNNIPGAISQKHITLYGGHFVQEDSPKEIAELIINFSKETS